MDVNESEIQEIQNYIEEYLRKMGMEKSEVEVHRTVKNGTNYVSTVLKATSKSEKGGRAHEDKYVIKFLKDDELFGGAPEESHMYEWSKCEQYVYEVVFPAMFQLQKTYDVKSDFKSAEYVSALLRNEKQFIIFKDLTVTGFTLRDRNLMLDADHVTVVMKRLAQFHGFSMALKHLDPEKYTEVTSANLDEKLFGGKIAKLPTFNTFNNNSANLQFSALIERVEIPQIRSKLVKIKDQFPEICQTLVKDDHAAPYSVIGHGDLWNNNIMFKYQDNKPVDAVLLDWQVMRHNSPVLDLFHLITTSVDESLQNSDGFDFIINTYYKNLSDELEKYNLDSNIVYPKDIFWSHLRTYAPLGLRICIMMWPFHCRMYDDTITVHDIFTNVQNIFKMSPASKTRYEGMWDFLVQVFNKNGMLDI